MPKRLKALRDCRGESYIDVIIIVLVSLMVVALALKVFPVFVAKNELNTFANELARVAEIEGHIGSATSAKATELKKTMNMDPTIEWSTTGKIQLNDAFTVTVSKVVDIGFFELGSFPITLTSKATGRSEAYWK